MPFYEGRRRLSPAKFNKSAYDRNFIKSRRLAILGKVCVGIIAQRNIYDRLLRPDKVRSVLVLVLRWASEAFPLLQSRTRPAGLERP